MVRSSFYFSFSIRLRVVASLKFSCLPITLFRVSQEDGTSLLAVFVAFDLLAAFTPAGQGVDETLPNLLLTSLDLISSDFSSAI